MGVVTHSGIPSLCLLYDIGQCMWSPMTQLSELRKDDQDKSYREDSERLFIGLVQLIFSLRFAV